MTASSASAAAGDRELLVLVLDLNPAWWGSQPDGDVRQMLQAVLTFANAHLLFRPGNEVALLGVCGDEAQFLYPSATNSGANAAAAPGSQSQQQLALTLSDGAKCERFTGMNDCVKDAADSLMRSARPDRLGLTVCVAGCLVKALCYASRREREIPPGDRLSARVLLLRGCRDEPAQYMALMNAVFAAQKRQIPVDACVLQSDSTLLRQAADLSGGFYLRVPRPGALLQCLLSVFLASPAARQATLVLPPACGPSDSRPACFCHRRLVSTAHVCSICLSVFCTYAPLCTTCHATFPRLAVPAGVGGAAGKRANRGAAGRTAAKQAAS